MRRVLGVALIVAGLIGVVAFSLAPGKRPPAYLSTYVPMKQSTRPAVALWVGDSYVAGSGASVPSRAYPVAVAAQMGWYLNRDAEGGTGFVADGRANSASFAPLGERLAATVKAVTPDLVIVDSGRNDPADMVATAERSYLARLTTAYPKARLILIVPAFVSRPAATANVLRTDYQSYAAAHPGAVVIDPTGWVPTQDVGADGVHPNDAGHAAYAARFVQAFKAAGLGATVSLS